MMTKWNYYCIFCGFSGVLLFLHGFFLSSSYTNRSSFTSNVYTDSFAMKNEYNRFQTHKSVLDKVVIVVIDALRYDFIAGTKVVKDMPFVASLLNQNQACLFPCRVHLPTVTMPRIKAMTVGSVSNFVDIVLNLGSSEVHQDNILSQAVKSKKNIVFYGDETWIRLFPRMFLRYEGTTSFFVSDFVEVDNNVTRNVMKELKQEDWDLMILHYLGLDHIGHLEGPFSSKITWKLNEMDHMIKTIHQQLEKWKETKKTDYLMIICGDHGMKDTGGHGGSSLGEILVPFLVLGTSCNATSEIFQVDIAVTLSVLMGLSIPQENVGKLIHGLVDKLPLIVQLDGYYRNIMQLIQNYNNVIGENSDIGVKETELYLEATKDQSEEKIQRAIDAYKKLSLHLNSKLIDSLTRFDALCLYLAMILLFQASCLPGIFRIHKIPDLRYTVLATILVTITIFQICNLNDYNSTLCGSNPPAILFSIFLSFIISFNMIIILNFGNSFMKYLNMIFTSIKNDRLLSFTVFCYLLQIISATSTSFIDEEHMIWYHWWCSWLMVTLITTNVKKDKISLLILIIMQRIIRKLNHTGDQWASLPDISDWLIESQHQSYMSCFFLAGLIWIFFSVNHSNFKRGRKFSKMWHFSSILSKCFTATCLIMIYFYRAAVKEVLLFETVQNFLSDKGIAEFEIFLYVFLVTAVIKLIVCVDVLKAIIDVWVLLVCMLLRPSNVILPSSLILSSDIVGKILRKQPNEITKLILIHHWLARVYFFYQGNSNSLASIDIASGYIGQTTYNSVIVGSLIISATYSMPILAYLLMIRQYIGFIGRHHHQQDWNIVKKFTQFSLSVWLMFENFAVFFYTMVIMRNRYHLFIWSVFSPKLLYLSANYLLLYPIVFIIQYFLNNYSSK